MENNVWILIGSLALKINETIRNLYINRSFLVGPNGKVVARYDKIHMFDISLNDKISFEESKHFKPGNQAILVQTNFAPLGMTICYDLRFPELFRKGIQMGANLFVVIACWPKIRIHHWKILLQARAIENQSYVFGVNRTGEEPNNKYSGNSLIIGPKGEIISEMKEEEGIMDAKLQFSEISKWRNEFPVLRNPH